MNMNTKRLLLLIVLVSVTTIADARLYHWVDPASGTTQLSGRAPAWYRSGSGPRIFVFENGQLIDDTAVPVGPQQRLALRGEAFGEMRDNSRIGAAAAPDYAQQAAESDLSAADTVPDAVAPEISGTSTLGRVRESADETLARLRGVIDAWEAQRSAEARAIIEQALVPPSE